MAKKLAGLASQILFEKDPPCGELVYVDEAGTSASQLRRPSNDGLNGESNALSDGIAELELSADWP